MQDSDPVTLQKQHRGTTFTFGVFPSTVFNVDVDNIVWFTVLPTSAGGSRSIFGTAARSADSVRILGANKPSSIDEYLRWGNSLGREDNAACERVQTGLRGRFATPGPIVDAQENCLNEFHAYLRAQIPDYP
jgi:hypothetical protein